MIILIYYHFHINGVREILVITTPEDKYQYEELLEWVFNKIKIIYKVQPAPEGLAQAFMMGESFIQNDSVCLILGDNLFY